MDYEKAYKQLVEDFSIILNLNTVKESGVISVEDVRKLIPELAESEDESIRKAMIKYFTNGKEYLSLTPYSREDYIAWLEKQGEPVDINPSEFDLRLNKLLKQFESLPKEELASSLSFYLNVVQNDGSYKEEKQGEQNRNTPVFTFDDVLALQCAMANAKDDSDEELYHALQCLHDRVYDAYSNEKQDEQKHVDLVAILKDYFANTPKEQQDKDWEELKHLNNFGWELVGQKPADKVEHKFKVGDWVIFNNNNKDSVYRIEKAENCQYTLRHILGGSMPLSYSSENMLRLWTIADTKDGDVLAVENIIFIYKRILASHIVSYCKLINNVFESTSDARTCCEGNSYIHPATKEQRDLLFAKMKEAGYEWDAEKKELKMNL